MVSSSPGYALARWLEETTLSQYDMVIQHRPGVKHGNADGLSRRPEVMPYCDCYEAGATLESLPCGGCDFCSRLHNQWARFEADVDDVVPLAVRKVSLGDETDWDDIISVDYSDQPEGAIWLPSYTPEELRKLQLEDSDLSQLIDWLEADRTPLLADLYLCSPTVKKFWLSKSQLEFQKRVLYYRWEGDSSQLLLLVPDALKEEVLSGCHDCPTSGHLGQKKTLDRVKRSFMWHELTTDTCIYVRTCPICNKNKKAKTKPRAGLRNFRAGAPMERVHMDILGPFPPSQLGNRYILLMIDQFTKWVEIHAIPEQTAEQTARIAVDQFFTRFGAPLQIHTDQGKNFDGQVMKALCHLYRIAKTRTTPYHPSGNGQAERYNRLLLQMIRCFRRAREKTWDEDLQLLAGAIRAMKNRSTGFSANMLMLGSETTQPIDVLFGAALRKDEDVSPGDYVKQLRKRLREVHSLATHKLRSQMQYQKRTYDLKLQENHYEVGDFVFRCNKASKVGSSRKLNPIWIGPLLITEVINPVLYRVRDRKREYVLHHDLLKRCEDRTIPFWLRKMRHNLMDLDTTIAYDASEQEVAQEAEPPVPVAPSVSDGAPDGQDQSVLTVDVSADSELAGADVAPAGQSLTSDADAPGEASDDGSRRDTNSTWMDECRNWGLQSLFSDSPTVHIYAQKGKSPLKGRGEMGKDSPKVSSPTKKGYSPTESTSSKGRQRKVPARLRDYAY